MALYFFLFNILPYSFLGLFCPDAKEPGIGTGRAKTANPLEVVFFWNDLDSLRLLNILKGDDQSCPLGRQFEFFSSAVCLLGGRGLPGEEDELGAVGLQLQSCTSACRESVDSFCLLGATEIPMVRATFLWVPATRNSSKLKPLPARTWVWYLTVGLLTMGPSGLDAGCGVMVPALACWGIASADVPRPLVEPRGHVPLTVLVEVGPQDHAIPPWLRPTGCSEREQPAEKN